MPPQASSPRTEFIRVWLAGAEASLNAHPVSVGAVLGILYLLQAIGRSPQKLFWHDEYVTYFTDTLPSFGAIWRALRDAPAVVDPPLYHFLGHASLRSGLPLEFAARLPSTLGFGVMLVSVYAILVRRTSVPVALSAAALVQAAPIQSFGVEARPYGFIVGCMAFAFLCWQRAAEKTERRGWALAGMTIALAATLASHYFAALAVACLVAGEMDRARRARKIDWPVWACMFAASLVILAYLPSLPAASAYKRLVTHPPGLGEVLLCYGLAYSPLLLPSLVGAALWPLRRDSVPRRGSPPPYEIAAALAFFLVPFGGLLLGRLVTGNYTGRYTLSFIVGTAILLGYALWQLDAQRTHFAVVLGVVALGFGMKTGIVDLLRHAPPASKVFDSYDHPALREYADLPVAVGSAEALYGSELYGNPTWKHRVTGVVDSVTDNETAGLAAFLRYRRLGWTVLPMQDAEEFIVAHRRFLMWGEKNISPTLRSKNARIEWEGTMGPASLYLVTLP